MFSVVRNINVERFPFFTFFSRTNFSILGAMLHKCLLKGLFSLWHPIKIWKKRTKTDASQSFSSFTKNQLLQPPQSPYRKEKRILWKNSDFSSYNATFSYTFNNVPSVAILRLCEVYALKICTKNRKKRKPYTKLFPLPFILQSWFLSIPSFFGGRTEWVIHSKV